jgi:hypothetical protein
LHAGFVSFGGAAEQGELQRVEVEWQFAVVEVVGGGGVAHGDRRHGE